MSGNSLVRQENTLARSSYKDISKENIIRYSVVRQILTGKIAGIEIGPYWAPSGAGQKGVQRESVKLVDWNPAKGATGLEEGRRGGAIMPGWWMILPEILKKGQTPSGLSWGKAPTDYSLRIIPYKLDDNYSHSERNSFYIHGTGGHGSDGCILLSPADRKYLVGMVSNCGGAWLRVYYNSQEMSDSINMADHINRTS